MVWWSILPLFSEPAPSPSYPACLRIVQFHCFDIWNVRKRFTWRQQDKLNLHHPFLMGKATKIWIALAITPCENPRSLNSKFWKILSPVDVVPLFVRIVFLAALIEHDYDTEGHANSDIKPTTSVAFSSEIARYDLRLWCVKLSGIIPKIKLSPKINYWPRNIKKRLKFGPTVKTLGEKIDSNWKFLLLVSCTHLNMHGRGKLSLDGFKLNRILARTTSSGSGHFAQAK